MYWFSLTTFSYTSLIKYFLSNKEIPFSHYRLPNTYSSLSVSAKESVVNYYSNRTTRIYCPFIFSALLDAPGPQSKRLEQPLRPASDLINPEKTQKTQDITKSRTALARSRRNQTFCTDRIFGEGETVTRRIENTLLKGLRRDLRKILATYQTEIIPHLLKQIEASCKKYGGTHAYDKLMYFQLFNTARDGSTCRYCATAKPWIAKDRTTQYMDNPNLVQKTTSLNQQGNYTNW
ncbi:hypothetical protein NQ317_015894 [Molorchus minor]|uniref:Uncharacterized protein n=1 Tax=Molorchus minor TaxID=1323400 RepID=A0ABQ9JDS7_9CUCU|nr:hypothetical protein NQ317_015894 [Molorchus minor]